MPRQNWYDWAPTDLAQRLRLLAGQLVIGIEEEDPDIIKNAVSDIGDTLYALEGAVAEMPEIPADAAGTLADAAEIQLEDR